MPRRPAGFALAAVLAVCCHGVPAQVLTVSPAATVTQLAPQLIQFAGSQANFENLVNGLAQGTPVQLTTVLPEGFTQVVTFTPTGALTPTQIAQTLEATRQQLIGLGIGAPTAEQIGVALMGGRLPTALGGTPVNGTLLSAAAGSTTQVTTAVNVQLVPSAPANTTVGATTPSSAVRINTSDSSVPAGATSRSPAPANTSSTPTTSPAPPPAVLTPFTPEPPVGIRPSIGRQGG